MKEQDKIKELFSEKLGNYSAPVKPELWNGIASKVAIGSVATTTTGLSLLTKGLIGFGAASIIGVSGYFLINGEAEPLNDIVEVSQSEILKSVSKEKSTISTDDSLASNKSVDKTVIELTEVDKPTTETVKLEAPVEIKEEETVYVPKVAQPVIPKNNSKENLVNITSNKTSKEEFIEDRHQVKEEPSTNKQTVQPIKKEATAEITLLPNSFTPNGDRVNDEFYIEFEGELLDFNIVILDNKNQTIFQSNDPNFKWTGANKFGEIVQKGSYYYIVTARDSNNNPINKYNTLSIER